jgi:NAD(P)-dependent dehydrogenase (short-subunit alcohol dehydrogenase family)
MASENNKKQKVVLITGSSQGIGQATALRFAQAGWSVVLAARSEGKLQNVAKQVEAAGGQALAVTTDLADPAQIDRLFEKSANRFGRLDCLVNNAVMSKSCDPHKFPLADWNEMMAVNLTAPFLCAQRAVQQMLDTGDGGSIINVSSIMSKLSMGTSLPYVVAKGGLEAMTRELAIRYGPDNIRAVSVLPGDIDTGITDTWAVDAKALMAHFHDMLPIERAGRPEEVADLIFFLASDQAGYISGTEITIDGGRSPALYPKSLWRKQLK